MDRNIDHYNKDMDWVEKYTYRMLDLDCVPELKLYKRNQTH